MDHNWKRCVQPFEGSVKIPTYVWKKRRKRPISSALEQNESAPWTDRRRKPPHGIHHPPIAITLTAGPGLRVATHVACRAMERLQSSCLWAVRRKEMWPLKLESDGGVRQRSGLHNSYLQRNWESGWLDGELQKCGFSLSKKGDMNVEEWSWESDWN